MATLRAELKAELEARSLFDDAPGRTYAKFALLLVAAAGCFAAMFLVGPVWLKALLFVPGMGASTGLVMMGHESGHGGVSRNRIVNDLLGYLAFPIGGGLAMSYWKWKHNTGHHSFPNVVGRDPDTEIRPMAMHAGQAPRNRFEALVQRHQGLAFWPFTLLLCFAMRVDGLKFLLSAHGRRLAPRRDRLVDGVCLALHLLAWLVLPIALGAGASTVLGFYLAWTLATGLILGAVFAPAHMALPMYRGYDENFVLQLRTTQNLLTNRLFSCLLIGLDHQIEHHLFQRMSHLHMRMASPIVRAFCARHGLPYAEQGWGAALWETTRAIDRMPQLELLERPPPADLAAMVEAPVALTPSEFRGGLPAP
jgi:fatty acid desaturase